MPFAKLQDIRIHYNIFLNTDPDAEVLLFIHGTGLNSSLWESMLPHLSDTYTLVTFDLRGFGQSEQGPLPPSWDLALSDILHLIQYLKLTAFHLVGHSFGASLAVKLSVQYPEKVKCLVLISTASVYPQQVAEKTAQSYFDMIEQEGLMTTIEKYLIPSTSLLPPDHPDVLKIVRSCSKLDLTFYLQMFSLLVTTRPIEELVQVGHPTLLLAGEFDTIYMPSLQAITANHIRNSTFYIVPDASNLVFIDQPELTARWIRNFIQRNQKEFIITKHKEQIYNELTSTIKNIFTPIPHENKQPVDSVIQVSLLHTFQVNANGKRITDGWNRRYAKNLFAFLVFHPVVTREQICDALFAHLPLTAALRNLKVYVNYLKKILGETSNGESLLTADREHIILRGRIECDALEFIEHLNACFDEVDEHEKQDRCLRLFNRLTTSEFMPGIFDEWYVELKERIESQLAVLAAWLTSINGAALATKLTDRFA